MPIIDALPSDYDTINTALQMAVERSTTAGLDFCIVTFDLPLYLKAKDIVASCGQDSPIKNVIVRLGAFHTSMSFLGCIGYIMAGSGIEDICKLIYSEGCVEKLLSGKAYARAIRCHSLIRLALALLIFKDLDFSNEEKDILIKLCSHNELSEENILDTEQQFLKQKFNKKLQQLKMNGPTAKLYVQYFEMTTLLLKFIHAEKCGNWKLHLDCLQKMIPFFITSGHFNYAKCSYLYLQDMFKIYTKLNPEYYRQFTQDGYFTIRRCEKFYSGISSDMTIEQTFMRNIHSREGLTHGRTVTPAITARWITSIPLQILIANQLETFCHLSMSGTSHQHKDAGTSRIEKDEKDVKTLTEWFNDHPPFITTNALMSLSTGIIGSADVNCHQAQSNGIQLIRDIIKGKVVDIKFQKKMKVLPLKSSFSKIQIDENMVIVDSDTLFRRMLLFRPSEIELQGYFAYELAPFPTSIFDESGMRKNTKSDLYKFFVPSEDHSLDSVAHVIDGGYLLHKIVWNPNDTFTEISENYVNFLKVHYTNYTVVFDGYPDLTSNLGTKTVERIRRNKQNTPEIQIKGDLKPLSKPDTFFANENNKKKFILFLREKLASAGIETKQAEEDADWLIISTAKEKAAQFKNIIIIGTDVDLLIILSMLPDQYNNIYFLKPSSGKVLEKLFNLNSYELPQYRLLLGFIHAFSGCDTTSAFFRIGKTTFTKFVLKNMDILHKYIEVFLKDNASDEEIGTASEFIVALLYGAKPNDTSLFKCRYISFVKQSKNTRFQLSLLPPTAESAKLHGKRVYLQMQQWRGRNLNPLEWGWMPTKNGLLPIRTVQKPAPDNLLQLISCKCTKNCEVNCGCKKLGIECSVFCKECQGINCDNRHVLNEDDVIQEVDEDIDFEIENGSIDEDI